MALRVKFDPWVVTLAVLILMIAVLGTCNDNSSIVDCSKRNKPQHYRDHKWTCDD